jgi:hypothetical protein
MLILSYSYRQKLYRFKSGKKLLCLTVCPMSYLGDGVSHKKCHIVKRIIENFFHKSFCKKGK